MTKRRIYAMNAAIIIIGWAVAPIITAWAVV